MTVIVADATGKKHEVQLPPEHRIVADAEVVKPGDQYLNWNIFLGDGKVKWMTVSNADIAENIGAQYALRIRRAVYCES